MRKVNKLQENSERQFNELRNEIDEQKEYFYQRDIKTLKENQTNSGVEELKNEMKNALKNIGNRTYGELPSFKIEIQK